MRLTKNTSISIGVGCVEGQKSVTLVTSVDDTTVTLYLEPERARQYAKMLTALAGTIDTNPKIRIMKIRSTFIGWMPKSAILRMHNGSDVERVYRNAGCLGSPVSLWYKGEEPTIDDSSCERQNGHLKAVMREVLAICEGAKFNTSDMQKIALGEAAAKLRDALPKAEGG